MNIKNNKEKLITIVILPIMWLIYFAFEIVTGRINDFYTFIVNLLLTLLFALTGYIIYLLSKKYENGFKKNNVFRIFIVLMIIEQGIKIVIKKYFFNYYLELIPGFLSFDPIINSDGSWLNARFGAGVGFNTLIILNIISLFLFYAIYRFYLSRNNKTFWVDTSFLFILSGAFCSLIDKVFYGGSLDYIGISNLFIADLKDIYINIGLFSLIILLYKIDYFKEDNSSLKDDFKILKEFLLYIKNDLFKKNN